MKKAFTLAEMMIVFLVIGVLSALLLPMFYENAPDKYLLETKKSYYMITTAIEQMLNSDPYALHGTFESGNIYRGDTDNDMYARKSLFCFTLAKALNASSFACSGRDYNSTEFTSNVRNAAINESNSYGVVNQCPEGAIYAFDNDAYTSGSSSYDLVAPLCLRLRQDGSGEPDYANLEYNIDKICETTSTYNPSIRVNPIMIRVQLTNFSYTGTINVHGVDEPVEYALICVSNQNTSNSTDKYKYGLAVRKDGKIVAGSLIQSYLQQE